MTPPLPVTILTEKSYLAMIHNAVGTNLFRNLYAVVDGVEKDITKDGVSSCALFVSGVLHHFHLLDATRSPNATVAGLKRSLESSGWREVEAPVPGAILLWEPMLQVDTESAHAGFFVGEDRAISNDWETRVPKEHHMTFGTNPDGTPVRAITNIYTYDF